MTWRLLPHLSFVRVLFGAGLGAGLFALSLLNFSVSSQALADELFHRGATQIPGGPIAPGSPRFADLARVVRPAVVNVSAQGQPKGEDAGSADKETEKGGGPNGLPVHSSGSGFIINAEGFIVTNNHVIDRADEIVVRLLDDRREYPATVVGRDAKTDLALLKIDPPEKLPFLYIGDSDELEVGDWVVAIGNQFQLGQTVTAGIVSAKSRRLPQAVSGPYDSFIQTDASINPGSSGGPLLNMKGQVVGINSAIFSPGRAQFGASGFNIGIGFSIPMNLATGILEQLKGGGKVTRGLLGVMIQSLEPDVAAALKISDLAGALVADIVPGSPASRAGFQPRDVIVRYGETDIHEHDELPLLVASTPIGAKIPVVVIRNGAEVTLRVVIDELKDTPRVKALTLRSDALGITVSALTAAARSELGDAQAKGILVESIVPGSPGDRAGLVPGDVIEEFGAQSIRGIEDLEAAAAKLKFGIPELLSVRRKEGSRIIAIKVRK